MQDSLKQIFDTDSASKCSLNIEFLRKIGTTVIENIQDMEIYFINLKMI